MIFHRSLNWFSVEGGHRSIIFSRIGGIQQDIYTEGLHFRLVQHTVNTIVAVFVTCDCVVEIKLHQWSRNMPDMSSRLLLMSGRELRPCRTFCPAGFNTHKMSDKEKKNDHWYLPVINWGICLTGAKNVQHFVRHAKNNFCDHYFTKAK